MKIVINSCHGGFGLSDAAVMRFAELSGIVLYMDTSSALLTRFYTVPVEEYAAILDQYQANSCYYCTGDIERTDPFLIQTVEELGAAASGRFAELKIVEIPDGVKYQIDEYDGYESVHEQHRVWS